MSAPATRERGILMSGPMVRATLDGRKTQTRRVIKPQPDIGPAEFSPAEVDEAWQAGFVDVRCPYGVPGDLLYVRETWAYFGGDEYLYQRDPGQVIYRASWDTDTRRPVWCTVDQPLGDGRWRPSIHMPKWAARIWLEITDVWVERVQEISADDAFAEGVGNDWQPESNQLATFARLWDSLNADRGYGWDTNPWVWVVGYRMLEGRADA